MPRIAEIADKAGVSLRTVFRHIEDVETLNREMAEQVEAEITPVVSAPLKATSWRGRLEEMLQRRAQIYEHVMPVKMAAGLRRFRSEFLMADYQRFLDEERTRLVAILPDVIVQNKPQLAALQMATSFQMWRRLRQDQRLSPEDALETLAFTVERLIQDV
ncbi:MAG: TetR/AcrR family transcriptional regulator [Pseudomonadota bacterium]